MMKRMLSPVDRCSEQRSGGRGAWGMIGRELDLGAEVGRQRGVKGGMTSGGISQADALSEMSRSTVCVLEV